MMSNLVKFDPGVNEEVVLKGILTDSASFDRAFRNYESRGRSLLSRSVSKQVVQRLKELSLQQFGIVIPGVVESYQRMMGSLGSINTGLSRLCGFYKDASKGFRDQLGKYRELIDLRTEEYAMLEATKSQKELELSDLNGASDISSPIERIRRENEIEDVEDRLFEVGVVMAQVSFTLDEAVHTKGLIRSSYRDHVEAFASYESAVEVGARMYDALSAVGPAYLQGAMLATGVSIFDDCVSKVSNHHDWLKSHVRSRLGVLHSGVSAPSERTTLTDHVAELLGK